MNADACPGLRVARVSALPRGMKSGGLSSVLKNVREKKVSSNPDSTAPNRSVIGLSKPEDTGQAKIICNVAGSNGGSAVTLAGLFNWAAGVGSGATPATRIREQMGIAIPGPECWTRPKPKPSIPLRLRRRAPQ